MSDTVSVIILSHNAQAYIAQAIDSVIAQSHQPHDVIVVDDSSDDSPAIVESFQKDHDNIRLHRMAPCSITAARNAGLELATGTYLSFLDADDMWLPDKSAKQMAALAEHDDAIGVFSPYFDFRNYIYDLGRPVPKQGHDDPSVRDIVFEQNMASSTVLIRRDRMGDLRFEQNTCEDTTFVAELRMRGRWVRVDEPLIAKRIHEQQASHGNRHRVVNTADRLEWCESRRDALGDETTDTIQGELRRHLVQFLESCYWKRDLKDLKVMCREVAELCPDEFGQSFLANTTIYPRWVYRLRDMIGSKSGR